MHDISGKKVAIIATNGFEQSELEVPLEKLKGAGAEVHVIALTKDDITGWKGGDWGSKVSVDRTIDDVSPDDYDALVLPGGQMNPDILRVEDKVISFIKTIFEQKKILAAICHAPWLLIEAGIIKGREVTSYGSIKTDVINAGGLWKDAEVVVDKGLVTSRKPDDLEAFCAKIAEEIAEGKHQQRAA